MFFFLTVTWDFLWFACNRHFGVTRFRKGQIWWFPAWRLVSPALPHGDHAVPLRRARARPLDGSVGRSRPVVGLIFGELLALTIVVTGFTLRPRRRDSVPPRGVRGAAKVKPK